MSIQQYFYPSSSGLSQSDSEHLEKESTDYLLSNSHENQSKDDSESTDDGFDRFSNHQVHLSTLCQWLCSSCMTSVVLISPTN